MPISLKSAVAAGLLATGAAAASGRTCGNLEVPKGLVAAAREFAKEEAVVGEMGLMSQSEIVVDTYIHVLASSEAESDGYLSDETIQAQMDVINDNYASTGISFKLVATQKLVKPEWASISDADTPEENEMKTALRQGSYRDLNLYFVNDYPYLGTCWYPEGVVDQSIEFLRDGCVILSGSVPDGPTANYNEGKTATHEIGHWFGLIHTFGEELVCGGEGDLVDDTPEESEPTSGCPADNEKDTCPAEGFDPIHNYMDYGTDPCMTEFTPGQAARMHSMWEAFRQYGAANTTGFDPEA